MGMSTQDKYYEPEDDNSGDFINQRVAELLKTKEYDPSLLTHLSEAISEASDADQYIIKDYVAQRDWHKLGMKLYYISAEYMEKYAEQHAIGEYNQGLLHD
jgi:outer membrane lipoprotein-sorting protein